MRASTIVLLNAVDASKDEASAAVPASQLFYISAQVVSTGASTGTLKLQFSNDIVNPQAPNGAAPTNWSDITGASVSVTAASVTAILKTEVCYAYIRAVYTHNNGSAGTVSANLQVMSN